MQASTKNFLDLTIRVFTARTPVSDLTFIAALPSLRGLDVKGTNVRDLAPILAHPTLLYDVSKPDYRDRLGFILDFADTPWRARTQHSMPFR